MGDFKKTIAKAKAEVAKAENEAFLARLEAIEEILQDAPPYDVLMACAHALAHATPVCCEKHEDEFKTEFLRALSDRIAVEREQVAAESDQDGDASPRVH
jgi:hypothetical protein